MQYNSAVSVCAVKRNCNGICSLKDDCKYEATSVKIEYERLLLAQRFYIAKPSLIKLLSKL
jgi:hypothetical protein